MDSVLSSTAGTRQRTRTNVSRRAGGCHLRMRASNSRYSILAGSTFQPRERGLERTWVRKDYNAFGGANWQRRPTGRLGPIGRGAADRPGLSGSPRLKRQVDQIIAAVPAAAAAVARGQSVRSSNGRRPTRSVSLPNIGAAMSDRNIGMATRLPATCQRTGCTYTALCVR